jgi:glycerophosphoryl diester phosphodiesterase
MRNVAVMMLILSSENRGREAQIGHPGDADILDAVGERRWTVAKPMLSAHRGGPEGMYEPNSLEAIKAALEVGVDLVEFDVRTTCDGGFVALHDAAIAGRLVADLTEAEVLALAPGTLRVTEILELIAGRAHGHVDLKDARLELEIVDLCASILGPDGFVVTTLEDVSVARIRSGRPEATVGLSLGKSTASLGLLAAVRLRTSELFPARRVRACGATMLVLHHRLARLGVLSWARRHDIDVLVWTINKPRLLRSVANDDRYWAFTTDYPRLARRLRETP